MASDLIEEMTRSAHASVGRSSGMSQGDLTIDGSQPIRLAVSSARPGSKSLISTFAGCEWIGERGSVNSPDHCPNAARVNASLKTNAGNAVSATDTDLTRSRSSSSSFRARSDSPCNIREFARTTMVTAEFQTSHRHGASWGDFNRSSIAIARAFHRS